MSLPISNEASACARAIRNQGQHFRYPWQERSLWEELQCPSAAVLLAERRKLTRRKHRRTDDDRESLLNAM
jgi:hypothetical protein